MPAGKRWKPGSATSSPNPTGTYGYRRIHADLAAENTRCSSEPIRHIVRSEDLVPCQPRPFWVTIEADAEGAAAIPDLVQRGFTAGHPGIKFVGCSVANHMRTSLVADALRNAAATSLITLGAIWQYDRLHPSNTPWPRSRPW